VSKNIQANLIRYNGDIGPTILDVDDKTDGPDGTTKPLTKDMLREMIVANFPELQNVKDADVKTELELIKQQQSEILQRLNQPIDTQVTGSYPEYRIMSDEDFPEALEDEKGATLIVMDTGDIYMNHGGTWGEF
jgi:hypothetical protein